MNEYLLYFLVQDEPTRRDCSQPGLTEQRGVNYSAFIQQEKEQINQPGRSSIRRRSTNTSQVSHLEREEADTLARQVIQQEKEQVGHLAENGADTLARQVIQQEKEQIHQPGRSSSRRRSRYTYQVGHLAGEGANTLARSDIQGAQHLPQSTFLNPYISQ